MSPSLPPILRPVPPPPLPPALSAVECRFVSLTFGEGNVTAPGFTLSAWRVNYPWVDSESSFTSSNATLNAVYDLCRYTLYSAAIDTYTDSNTVGPRAGAA